MVMSLQSVRPTKQIVAIARKQPYLSPETDPKIRQAITIILFSCRRSSCKELPVDRLSPRWDRFVHVLRTSFRCKCIRANHS